MEYCGIVDEKYINRIYDDLLREQMELMRKMKTSDKELDKNSAKKIQMMNDIMIRLIKFREFRKKE